MKTWFLAMSLLCAIPFLNGRDHMAIAHHSNLFEPCVTADIPPRLGTGTETYLETEIKYPELAMENGIEGEVILFVEILSTGKVDSVQVIQGIGFGCDEEAVRLLKNMPAWQPATRNGIPVESSGLMKVRFRLW